MKILSKKYPELFIYDLGVKFTKGQVETNDVEIVEALKGLGEYGFEFEGEIEKKEKPVSKMKKAELLIVAAEKGIAIPEGAINADIVKLIEDGEANGDGTE